MPAWQMLGIMGLGIVFFVMERRSFIARSGTRLETLEKRISSLETKVTASNDKVVSLLDQQLESLKKIEAGQAENFSRMWQLTMRSSNLTNERSDAEH